MTTLYIFRHGHYNSPKPVAPYRLPGFHLSDEGILRVEALAASLRTEHIASVFASPLERTLETAVILAKPHNLTPIPDERLLEVRSPIEGKTPKFIDLLGGWDWSIYDTSWYRERHGETIEEVYMRIHEFVEEKRREYAGKSLIVVSHGDPVMLIASYHMGIPRIPKSLAAMRYARPAEGFRLDFSDGRDKAKVYPIVAS